MVWVLFLFFFNTQLLRPADTYKIANLAHHSKSLGTAELDEQKCSQKIGILPGPTKK